MNDFLSNPLNKNILLINYPEDCSSMVDYIVDIYKRRVNWHIGHKFFIDKSFKFENIIDLLSKGDLFANNIYLELIYSTKILVSMQNELTTLLNKLNDNVFVIIKSEKLIKKELNNEFYKKISNIGISLFISSTSIESIVKYELKQHNIKIEENALSELLRLNHGNSNSLMQELKKIVLLYDKESVITLKNIKDNIINNSNYNIYEFSDKYLNGDLNSCMNIVDIIYQNPKEAFLIPWCFYEDIKKLLKIKSFLSQTNKTGDIYKQLHIYNDRSYRNCLNRLSVASIIEILNELSLLDLSIKGLLLLNQKDKIILILKLFCR